MATTVYLSLGTNLGDRKQNLRDAITNLKGFGFSNTRISPIVESPALLPDGAEADWNRPFLNLIMHGETTLSPTEFLAHTKRIQNQLGRDTTTSRWSPRPMDIDIMLWGNEQISTIELNVPHAELSKRAFVLSPLLHIAPGLTFPGQGSETVIERSRTLSDHIPLWMGIVNVTPDSFSDGNSYSELEEIQTATINMVESGAQIIDIGAESTRPGANPLTPGEEWTRLKPTLEKIMAAIGNDVLRPLISVDTYHAAVAEKALEMDVDIINDVSGFADPKMVTLAVEATQQINPKQFIVMHSLSVPASSNVTLKQGCDPVAEVSEWLAQKTESWQQAGINLDQVIFDPGVGFGKSSLHSLLLLRRIKDFANCGLRVLVGHSRKSFMKPFVERPPKERDIDTIGVSLSLTDPHQGVDIIRVHNVADHHRAYLSAAHVRNYRDIRLSTRNQIQTGDDF